MHTPDRARQIIAEECEGGYGTEAQREAAVARLEDECDMHPQQARRVLDEYSAEEDGA